MRLKNTTTHPRLLSCFGSFHSEGHVLLWLYPMERLFWHIYPHGWLQQLQKKKKKKRSALFFSPHKQTQCNCWEPWGIQALTWDRNGGSAKCVTLLTPHTQECLKRVTFDLKPKCYILFPLPFTVSTVKCQSVCDLPTGAKHAIQRVLQTFAHQLWVCRETSDMHFLRESLYAVILGDCWLLPCQPLYHTYQM